jgi:hypothetical protein
MQKIKKIMFSRKNLQRDIGITILFFLTAVSFARAGNLDSPGSPGATMFTVNDIFQKLTTNQNAIEGDHSFAPSADPASSFHTLKEIYEAIPTIDPLKIKQNESYLGISGTLTPDGGTAGSADLFNGKTANLNNDWNLDTGALNLACNTNTFDGSGNIVTDSFDGAGNGNDRWCMKDTGNAGADEILTGKIGWVNGQEVTGAMANVGQQNITPSIADQTITEGFHDGTGTVSGDTDLVSGNIKSGVNLFGVAGNSNVVDTATGDATVGEILSGKKAWVDGAEVTGTASIFAYGDDDASKVLTSATGAGTFNAVNLTVGRVKSGTAYGVGLSGDYPSATYPLSGDTGATDATATEICNTNEAWTKAGALLTGTMNPLAKNIGVGNTFCGVAGTLLANEKNGTAGATVADYAFYTQAMGGVDDYNNNGSRPSDSYSGTWTTCDSGNDYCDSDDATNADKKDDSTTVVWSKWLDAGTTHTWFWANNCYEPGTAENPGTCVSSGDGACQCVKKPAGVKVGCEALGDGNWRLPYQKELMQAYIDGSWGNLSSAGYNYWSATTSSNSTQNAWVVYLGNGGTNYNSKTNSASYRVRCVR